MNISTHAPHPIPDQQRLDGMQDETLTRMIELIQSKRVFAARLRQAGVPVLATLQAEQRRRQRTRQAATS